MLSNFVEWLLENIFVTSCHSHIRFSALDSDYDDMQSCITVCGVLVELFAKNHSTKLGNKL